jgi:proline iminopeptidase
LSRAWPEARYIVVADAGHSALEPGVRAALVNATENHRLSLNDDDLFAPRFPWET